MAWWKWYQIEYKDPLSHIYSVMFWRMPTFYQTYYNRTKTWWKPDEHGWWVGSWCWWSQSIQRFGIFLPIRQEPKPKWRQMILLEVAPMGDIQFVASRTLQNYFILISCFSGTTHRSGATLIYIWSQNEIVVNFPFSFFWAFKLYLSETANQCHRWFNFQIKFKSRKPLKKICLKSWILYSLFLFHFDVWWNVNRIFIVPIAIISDRLSLVGFRR